MSRKNILWVIIAVVVITAAAYLYSTNQAKTVSAASVVIATSSLYTSSSTPAISGTAQNTTEVRIQIESENIGAGADGIIGDCTAKVTPEETWNCTIVPSAHAASIKSGNYKVSATGIDSNGNSASAVIAQLTVASAQPAKPNTHATSNTPASSSIAISNVSGHSVTVMYSGLKEIDGGWATPPTYLYVQNEGLSKPSIEVPLRGASAGTITFVLPANAPVGKYTITPVGIPTEKKAPCPIGDCTSGYGTTNHEIFTSFELLSDGTIQY